MLGYRINKEDLNDKTYNVSLSSIRALAERWFFFGNIRGNEIM